MIPQHHLDHVAEQSARFASLTSGALDVTVAHLDWTIRELVAHLGAVYSMVIANTAAPGADVVRPGDEAVAPEGDGINEWFAERRSTLLSTLEAADGDAVTWTFAGERTINWWIRRMAAETAVHCWDADSAVNGDDVEPIAGDLATDAIDEYLEVGLRFSSSRPDRVYPAESLHLHRTDGPGEWMLVGDGEGGVAVTHEHGKGDAAVRGPASALLLWMWGRSERDIEIFGDEAVAATWRALAP